MRFKVDSKVKNVKCSADRLLKKKGTGKAVEIRIGALPCPVSYMYQFKHVYLL